LLGEYRDDRYDSVAYVPQASLAAANSRIEALMKAHAAFLDQAAAYLAEVKHCTSLAEARRVASAGLKALASAADAEGKA
jgi:hypothetical protein